MTEREWLASTNPEVMLGHLGDRLSDRKARLYASARARCLWERLGDRRSREAVEVAERHADGLASASELLAAFRAAHAAWAAIPHRSGGRWSLRNVGRGFASGKSAAGVARNAADPTLNRRTMANALRVGAKAEFVLANLLRDLFGPLPFRSVAVDPHWLTWNGGAVRALAADIYEGRTFDHLPILADALEDAGCHDLEMLTHCRQAEAHVRGCWVIDLLLGKE